MTAISKVTSFDRIVAAFKSHTTDDLNEQQRVELERWNFADNLIRTYQDSKTIIGMMMAKFDISQAQSYRDLANAKRFFGAVNFNDKDYYRVLYAEQLEEYAKQAASKFDFKTAATCLKEAAEIRGLKASDEIKDLYLELEPCQFVLSVTVINEGQKRVAEIDLDRLENVVEAEFTIVAEAVNAAPSVSEAQMQKLLND